MQNIMMDIVKKKGLGAVTTLHNQAMEKLIGETY